MQAAIDSGHGVCAMPRNAVGCTGAWRLYNVQWSVEGHGKSTIDTTVRAGARGQCRTLVRTGAW